MGRRRNKAERRKQREGESTAAELAPRPRLPFGDHVDPVQFVTAYAKLTAVSMQRADFYGALLAEAYERHGKDSLWGDVYTAPGDDSSPVKTGEYITALAQLESGERDRAARLARDGIKIGVEAQKADMLASYGRIAVDSMRALARELGRDEDDPGVREAMQRAVLAARHELDSAAA